MKKLNLSQKNSLKRVLSLDEMKSIWGGMNASITCTCTLYLYYDYKPSLEERAEEPTGDFYTPEDCQAGCNETCVTLYQNCKRAVGHYNIQGGYGSGSGSV